MEQVLKDIKKRGYITKEEFLSHTKAIELFELIETILNYLKKYEEYKDLTISDKHKWFISEEIVKNWKLFGLPNN